MSNILRFEPRTGSAIPPVAIPRNPDRRCFDVIEKSLHEACANEPELMVRLFANVVDQHLASALEPAGRRPWLEQALDQVLMMIPLAPAEDEKS